MNRKEKYLNVRVYDLEKRALDVMCEREGRKTSEMLREVIREAARNRGIYNQGLSDLSEKQQPSKQPA